MRYRRKVSPRKAWAALATTLVVVSGALGHAQRPTARDPLRNQGGVPLKKARPDAGDPLAKAPALRRPATWISPFYISSSLVRWHTAGCILLSLSAG